LRVAACPFHACPGSTPNAKIVASGDRVAWHFTGRATHHGTRAGIPPTGKRVEVSGIIMSPFEDGLRKEDWVSVDVLSIPQQVGAIPA
jgi:predicted ester cyclase